MIRPFSFLALNGHVPSMRSHPKMYKGEGLKSLLLSALLSFLS